MSGLHARNSSAQVNGPGQQGFILSQPEEGLKRGEKKSPLATNVLEHAFQQQAHFPEFANVIDGRKVHDMDTQYPAVANQRELCHQAPVVNFALAYRDLHFFPAAVTKLHMADILHQLINITSTMWAMDIVTWIKCQAQAFHVVAEHGNRCRILTQASYLAAHSDLHSLSAGNPHQLPQSFNFLVEGHPKFPGINRYRDDTRQPGKTTDGIKLMKKIILACRRLERVSHHVKAVRVVTLKDCCIQVVDNLFRCQVLAVLLDGNFNRGVFQVGNALHRFIKRKVFKTLRCGGN